MLWVKVGEPHKPNRVIKEQHEETDLSNAEERKEVNIGKQILQLISLCETTDASYTDTLKKIKKLAIFLIKMHSAELNTTNNK